MIFRELPHGAGPVANTQDFRDLHPSQCDERKNTHPPQLGADSAQGAKDRVVMMDSFLGNQSHLESYAS
jgi:hypothetical protein